MVRFSVPSIRESVAIVRYKDPKFESIRKLPLTGATKSEPLEVLQ